MRFYPCKGKLDIDKLFYMLLKLSAAMLHILKETKFEDEIARYIAIKSLEWEGGEIDISVVKLITSWLVNRYFAVSSQQMIAKSIRNLTRHRYW